MGTFAAEEAAWRIKAHADDISHSAYDVAYCLKRENDTELLRNRIAGIRRLAVAITTAADEFGLALGTEETI